MNIQLKQRLVGAVVLVALAVIFIPMLLPGKGDLSGSIKGSNIPPAPDYRFPPVKSAPPAPAMTEPPVIPLGERPKSEVAVGESKTSDAEKPAKEESPNIADTATLSSPKKKPVVDIAETVKIADKPSSLKKATVKTKPDQVSGWIVQVGSFSDSKNAKGLRDKLRKLGHVSFVEAVKAKSGTVYRVRVGPELTRKSAEKLSERLAKEAQLTGLVQVYP